MPHAMIGAEVEVRATALTVEILHGGQRVAATPRLWGPRGHGQRPSTRTARESTATMAPWPPSRIISWAHRSVLGRQRWSSDPARQAAARAGRTARAWR